MKHRIYIMHRRFMYSVIGVLLWMLIGGTSCKKYLNEKPAQNLAVPSTVKDLRAVLDNTLANVVSPSLQELGSDDYYLETGVWSGLDQELRQFYLWAPDARLSTNQWEWNYPYKVVYEANFVLDLLPRIVIKQDEQTEAANVKGCALFHRAFMFYQLAQLFCKPYSTTAATDPGIVIKTTPVVDERVTRSTVQQTYAQVIDDLKLAAELLPATQRVNTRPNKAAAYGLLARACLSMRDYTNAELYADKSLAVYSYLVDYNTLTPAASPVLPTNPLNNQEILFLSGNTIAGVFSQNLGAIPDSLLYRTYQANDLRKIVFYGNNGRYWQGSYATYQGSYSIFDGVATDEVMLIRAESRVRNGNMAGGLGDLNTLLRKRWKTGTFTNITASGSADALDKVLLERRKELPFRCLRWTDVRRFNLDGANITPKRIINNVTYSLPPNDPRWVFLIPDVEINRSGIQQNPR
jgi:hypothetical protein